MKFRRNLLSHYKNFQITEGWRFLISDQRREWRKISFGFVVTSTKTTTRYFHLLLDWALSGSTFFVNTSFILNEKNVIGLYFSEDSQEAKPADRTIRIDVLEQNLMLYARQLLFILLIKEEALSAEEKAKFILEVTGNIMVRPKTAKRVRMLLRYL